MTALIVCGILYTALKERRKRVQPQEPAAVKVEIRTTPPGASVRVNNEFGCTSTCSLTLPPGLHQLQASLQGYETALSTLNVSPGLPAIAEMQLDPVPPGIRIYTDLNAGKVYLDDRLTGELQDGQFILDRLAPGTHSIRVAGPSGEAAFSFEAAPVKAPTLIGQVSARNMLALVAGNYASEARFYASEPGLSLALDGAGFGVVPPEGIGLDNLKSGDRMLEVGAGSKQRKVLLSVGPRPVLTVFLKLDLNAGTLVAITGEDNVTLFLNEKEYRRRSERGQVRIPALPVGKYLVRATKDGFQPAPPLEAEIRKGEETRLEFLLRPEPKVASLRIRGAAPGMLVTLDEGSLGAVSADGTLSAAGIAPGEHTIDLRLQGYTPRRLTRQFRAGETTDLADSDVAMERALGTIRIQLSPPDSRVLIRRSDDTGSRQAAGTTLALQEGIYTLSAQAAGYEERSATVQIMAGEIKTIDLRLERVKPPPPKPPPAGTMLDWEQPEKWVMDGSWQVRKGGNHVFYRMVPTAGVFTFHIAQFRGKRLQWFFCYTDSRNHVMFQLDKKHFTRRDVVNGRASETQLAHSLGVRESYQVRVEVSAEEIVHQILDRDAWKTLDRFAPGGRNLPAGKFGMYIPGGDEYGLSNFRFQPK
jgi:hypothetical protein